MIISLSYLIRQVKTFMLWPESPNMSPTVKLKLLMKSFLFPMVGSIVKLQITKLIVYTERALKIAYKIKILSRWKFRRWKISSVEIFVGWNVSSVEMFRRWKCLLRRWKFFVGGNFVTWPNFRHFPPTKFSPIR